MYLIFYDDFNIFRVCARVAREREYKHLVVYLQWHCNCIWIVRFFAAHSHRTRVKLVFVCIEKVLGLRKYRSENYIISSH